ncbi:MAG: hypothetical protein N4A49_08755 [Marinifilaceae bacterium]|nr:hypothetical protein [Marinifilaceae bacterium]
MINRDNPNSGGPDSDKMMYSLEELRDQFQDFDILELEEQKLRLTEGYGHNGEGVVIRFLAQKK